MAANDDDFSIVIDDHTPSTSKARPQSRNANHEVSHSNVEAEKSREESLRQELAGVKKVNESIEGLLQSLEKAKANMKVGISHPWEPIADLTRPSIPLSALLHRY